MAGRRNRRRAAAAPAGGERGFSSFLKIAGAVIGVATGVTGLVFAFWPDLKPSPASTEQSAKLSDLKLDPDAPFRQYLQRIDQPTTGYTAARLAERGALVRFRVAITGFKGRELRLKWELFDAQRDDQLDESKAVAVTPTNERNEAMWSFWIPLPRRPGPYLAVVELLEQKETHTVELAALETDEFTRTS